VRGREGEYVRQKVMEPLSGLMRSRLLWLAVSSLIGVSLGVPALAGESGAQTAAPPFLAREGIPPPGANVPCEPNRRHPHPVVLVHGTFETMEQNRAVLSPRLKQRGYRVFALRYGNRGLGPIRTPHASSARRGQGAGLHGSPEGLARRPQPGRDDARAVDQVPRREGQSGGHGRHRSLQLRHGAQPEKPPGHPRCPNPCTTCDRQLAGSGFLRRLNSGDDTPGPCSFTPYTRCFLRGTLRTENLTPHDYSGGLPVTHQNIYNDPFAQKLVLDALANPGTATRNAPSPAKKRTPGLTSGGRTLLSVTQVSGFQHVRLHNQRGG
jgi:triacylglycerol lipase